MTRPVVGVLALQGGVAEHLDVLGSLGARAVRVRSASDLVSEAGDPLVDALVLPGGESSTIDRLSRIFGVAETLRAVISGGLPTLGTCAGLIMLAREIEDPGPGQRSLGVLDVTVRRNAFGSQVDSAEVTLPWHSTPTTDPARSPGSDDADHPGRVCASSSVRAAFIRAPQVTRVGNGVEVLAHYGEAVVAVRQGNVLGISFHPELTGDTTVHEELLDGLGS